MRGNSNAGEGRQRQEGNGERRARAADRRGKPLESEPRTWQPDETSRQGVRRSKPSRVCETPRAEHRQGGIPAGKWTPGADVAMEGWNPKEGARRVRATSGSMRLEL